jgi:hypothetical protein
MDRRYAVSFALTAGLSAAVTSTQINVTADLAEVAAGAIAMSLGGYLARKNRSGALPSRKGAARWLRHATIATTRSKRSKSSSAPTGLREKYAITPSLPLHLMKNVGK